MKRFDCARLFLSASAALGLALFATGCPSDDDPDEQPDAEENGDVDDPDAEPEADAEPEPEDARAGTLAVRDVEVTNPEAEENNRGANLTIDFLNLLETEVRDSTGSALTGCEVSTYGADDRVYEDEGDVTISGTGVGDEDGSFTCSYNDDEGVYNCVIAEGEGADLDLAYLDNGNGDAVELTIAESELADDYEVGGSRVELEGFDDEDLDGERFPVLGAEARNGDTVVSLRPGDFEDDLDESADDGSFRFLIGIGDGHFAGNETNFLIGDEDGDTTVSIEKPAGSYVDAIDVQADPIGEGMVLGEGEDNGVPYVQPHEFPLPPEGEDEVEGDVKMGCGEDLDGEPDCGIVPDDPAGSLQAFVIDGRTTDADLEGADPHSIPEPEEEWAIFSCAALGSSENTLTEEAINTVLDTDPTRVRMRAMHVNGELIPDEDGQNETTVLVGHELVGYTDVEENGD